MGSGLHTLHSTRRDPRPKVSAPARASSPYALVCTASAPSPALSAGSGGLRGWGLGFCTPLWLPCPARSPIDVPKPSSTEHTISLPRGPDREPGCPWERAQPPGGLFCCWPQSVPGSLDPSLPPPGRCRESPAGPQEVGPPCGQKVGWEWGLLPLGATRDPRWAGNHRRAVPRPLRLLPNLAPPGGGGGLSGREARETCSSRCLHKGQLQGPGVGRHFKGVSDRAGGRTDLTTNGQLVLVQPTGQHRRQVTGQQGPHGAKASRYRTGFEKGPGRAQ